VEAGPTWLGEDVTLDISVLAVHFDRAVTDALTQDLGVLEIDVHHGGSVGLLAGRLGGAVEISVGVVVVDESTDQPGRQPCELH
jgi:hypothetical protein